MTIKDILEKIKSVFKKIWWVVFIPIIALIVKLITGKDPQIKKDTKKVQELTKQTDALKEIVKDTSNLDKAISDTKQKKPEHSDNIKKILTDLK